MNKEKIEQNKGLVYTFGVVILTLALYLNKVCLRRGNSPGGFLHLHIEH